MYQNKSFLAVVPARGGSKGIPGKNITPIFGVPLINYTLREASNSKYIDRIVVTTDSKKIANTAKSEEVDIVMRPPHLATDTSKTIEAVLHLISSLDKQYDYLVLLQPTQPLREAFHIDQAIEMVIDKNISSLVSITPASENPIFMRRMDKSGCLSALLDASSTIRRQELEPFYLVNGAIYINRISDLGEHTSFNDNAYGYLMDREFSLDIDTPDDLKKFEEIIQTRCKNSR